jgi:hypothetical protein
MADDDVFKKKMFSKIAEEAPMSELTNVKETRRWLARSPVQTR